MVAVPVQQPPSSHFIAAWSSSRCVRRRFSGKTSSGEPFSCPPLPHSPRHLSHGKHIALLWSWVLIFVHCFSPISGCASAPAPYVELTLAHGYAPRTSPASPTDAALRRALRKQQPLCRRAVCARCCVVVQLRRVQHPGERPAAPRPAAPRGHAMQLLLSPLVEPPPLWSSPYSNGRLFPRKKKYDRSCMRVVERRKEKHLIRCTRKQSYLGPRTCMHANSWLHTVKASKPPPRPDLMRP